MAQEASQHKTLPYSTEAEKAVLGGIMLKNEAWDLVVVKVSEEDFHRLVLISQKEDVPIHTIGKVTNNSRLDINDLINIRRDKLEDVYFNSLEKIVNEN